MTLSRRDMLVSSAALLASLPAGFFSNQARARAGAWQLPEKSGVQVVDNEWIDLKDGTKLSARLWLPVNARAPVVLEYIPYRKRDLYRAHDDSWGHQLAQYGVAFARVDARGSGESQGIITDEYLDQELNDGAEIIAWLARQSWSNGNVGMRGISWGGINTLQVAALAPPALKAIMPMCCTDTRYTDDAHYIGGALGLTDLQWGVQFKAVMALPPDPAIVGDAWRGEWRQRLDATPAILAEWLSHQTNDAYWKRGSVSMDYRRIKCPVYIVDGWVDTYVNTVTRILEGISTPRKALFGPWAHNYPESASPGPSLEWAYEEVRWWKQWLAGEDTGIMQEPMLRAYMPYRTSSEIYPADTPGRWIAEDHWPTKNISPHTWYLNAGKLSAHAEEAKPVSLVADKIVGLRKPEWLPFPPEGMPLEQTPDDQKSLVFDSERLSSDIEILGHPRAKIRVASNQPVAKLAVRLCEVLPDGTSWLVTYGLLNLTHRDGHEQPKPLTPGTPYDVDIELSLIAHRFKRGSKIRVALSESLWPLVWPSPQIVELTVTSGASRLELPVRNAAHDPPFPIPVKTTDSKPAPRRAPLNQSGPDAEGWYEIKQDPKAVSYQIADTKTTVTGILGQRQTLRIREGDNNSCVWQGERTGGFERPDWNCSIHSEYKLTSTAQYFLIEELVRAYENNEQIFERSNSARIPREFM